MVAVIDGKVMPEQVLTAISGLIKPLDIAYNQE